jgi:pyruvate/2-oxoglutarate dehydrogenase complex dihydrolipoamide dehydrogenase (E3) component
MKFDAIVLGAGQAGPSLAGRLTAAGMSVALVERKWLGGTCVNTGCMPTKTLVASARAAHVARRALDYGVVIDGPVTVDMKRVKARAEGIVMGARGNLEKWLGGMERCTVIHGHARFESAKTIRVGDRVITGERIFINVGGRARIPDFPGIEGLQYLTNTSMVELDVLPEHLVVIGGSYVGLEFAQMYRRFGSQVTVVEKASRIISREDEAVSKTVKEFLEAEGVAFRLDAECIGFASAADGATVHVDCTHGDRSVKGSHVLLAVGRQPNTDDLGLDRAGIAVDEHGYVVVDDELRTNVPGVWAMGDCNGRGAFTHTSYNDFEIVAANVLDGDPRRLSERIPTYALYVDPPLGRVGMNETEARRRGKPFLIGTYPMARVGRAKEKGETAGFMQVIVDVETKKILGGTILGVEGDEAIHGILDMMYAGVPYTTLQRSVAIHPTVSELIPTMLGTLKPG